MKRSNYFQNFNDLVTLQFMLSLLRVMFLLLRKFYFTQRFAQLIPGGSKQLSQFFRENKMRQIRDPCVKKTFKFYLEQSTEIKRRIQNTG